MSGEKLGEVNFNHALYIHSYLLKPHLTMTRKNDTFLQKLLKMQGWHKKYRNKERLLHSEAFTIVPTLKSVALYSTTLLHVGTMVNAPLCSSIPCFCALYASPTSLVAL